MWFLTNLSCNNKFNEVFMFLNSENPDIFCCTETWLSLDSPNSLFCRAGYHVIRYDRDSRGGGANFKRLLFSPSCQDTK